MRLLPTIAIAAMSVMVVPAQEAPDNAAWQASITGQIEAFRQEDGASALEFASSGFQVQFDDPQLFYEAVLASGYEPLMHSRSHSFGQFEKLDDENVLQIVLLVGPDQGLYEAIFHMIDEPKGWRVEGVALRREEGIAI